MANDSVSPRLLSRAGNGRAGAPPAGLLTDGASGAPLYRELQRRLTRALSAGVWQPGEALPSEARLAADHGVSIGTVRKAIDELVAERILLRQQGRGTFVATHTPDRLLFHFFHIVGRHVAGERGHAAPREMPVTTLRAFRRARASAEVARELAIDPGAPILQIENLLHLSRRPVLFDQISISAPMFPGLERRGFEQREGTIYGLYQQRYGISVVRSAERLSAAACPAPVARLLGLRTGHPVLKIRRVAFTYDDRPVESRVSWVDTREHEYLSDLWKNDADHDR
jgi:GntR family transcriptional regulator